MNSLYGGITLIYTPYLGLRIVVFINAIK